MFFKKSTISDNRIENFGRWPVRLTNFYLIDEYEFPATNFPENFFVQEGNFLHETDVGTQAVREGAVVVVNPGHRHTIKQPEEVVLTRLRYLPEWLTLEYEIIANSPNLLTLFFDQSWFRHPREDNLHVFTTRNEGAGRIRDELQYLRNLLKEKRQLEPITRVSVLKLMMLLTDEHQRFWRGVSEIEILPRQSTLSTRSKRRFVDLQFLIQRKYHVVDLRKGRSKQLSKISPACRWMTMPADVVFFMPHAVSSQVAMNLAAFPRKWDLPRLPNSVVSSKRSLIFRLRFTERNSAS